jgi:heat shock protein HspQ
MIMLNDEIRGDSVFANEPKFKPGQLVKHKRYHYRGVVVEYDLHCQAADDWYVSNQTQPDRNQPWYHVLVHNSAVNTYAAETSLMPDDTHEPIIHPLVDFFFSKFNGSHYVRNDEPWAG